MLPVRLLLLLLLEFSSQSIIVVVQRLVWHRVRGGHIDNLSVGGRSGRQVHRFDGGSRNDDRIRTARVQTVGVVAVAISHWDFEQLNVGAQMMEATGMIGHVARVIRIVVVQRCRGGDNRTGLVQVMDNVLGGRVHAGKLRRRCRHVGDHLVVVRLLLMIMMMLVAVVLMLVLVVLRMAVVMLLMLLMVGHLIDCRIIGSGQNNATGRHDRRDRSQQTEQVVAVIVDDAAVKTTVATDACVTSCDECPHIANLLMLRL